MGTAVMLKTRHVIEFTRNGFHHAISTYGIGKKQPIFCNLVTKIISRFPQNKIAVRNLTAAFPEADEAVIKSLNIEMWRNLACFSENSAILIDYVLKLIRE